MHDAPGALTNVVRNGRGFGGRDETNKTGASGFTGGRVCFSSFVSCVIVVLVARVFLSF